MVWAVSSFSMSSGGGSCRLGEEDLAEDKGVVKAPCGNCGCLMLLDAERLGIRGLWEEGRGA
jgi:hypothetical protein